MHTEGTYKDNAVHLITMEVKHDYNFHLYIGVDKREQHQKE